MMGFISYLVNGISLGSVYAIIALGYTMVYGIAKMLNFAHGDVIMIGGFVGSLQAGGADYSYRSQLFSAEYSASHLWIQYEVLYLRGVHGTSFSG